MYRFWVVLGLTDTEMEMEDSDKKVRTTNKFLKQQRTIRQLHKQPCESPNCSKDQQHARTRAHRSLGSVYGTLARGRSNLPPMKSLKQHLADLFETQSA